MDDALGVRGLQRIGDLRAQRDHDPRLDGLLACVVAQSLSLQQFHHQVGEALGFTDVVHGANVRMV